MSEEDLAQAQGAVYAFENEAWQPVTSGLSMIGLYYHPESGLYRIVGLDADTSDVTLNAALVAETEYQQASERFHQFTDHEGKVCGINFASDEDAEAFAAAVQQSLRALSELAAAAKVEEEAQRKREAEEKAKKQRGDAEKEMARKKEEEAQRKREEDSRRQKEEEARKKKADDEARRRKEEDERARKEFEEQKKREAKVEEEKKKKKEEEERKKRQEEAKRKEEERLQKEREDEEERARSASRPAKRGLPQLDPQALQKAAVEDRKDPNKPTTPRATLDQRYRHRLANIRTKIALIQGLIQVKAGNGDDFIVHIIDDADPNKKTEPQPVLLQLRDEVKKLTSLQQAKSAQEKRYFTQFGEPQKEKDPRLDAEVDKLLGDLASIDNEAEHFEARKDSMQQQHAEQLEDNEAAALEEEQNRRYEEERQQLEEMARKRAEDLARKKEEEQKRNEEAQRQADQRRAAAAAAYKPPGSKKAAAVTGSGARPEPVPAIKTLASVAPASSPELEAFKRDLLASMRKEVQSFKDSLIQDIRFDM